MSGAAGKTRTFNLLIRSQMLYPIELRLRDGVGIQQESEVGVKREMKTACGLLGRSGFCIRPGGWTAA